MKPRHCWYYSLLIAFFLSVSASRCSSSVLVSAGNFTRIYDPSEANFSWYINDHTLVMGPGNVWHLLGITHTNPADPLFEVNLAHGTFSPDVNSSQFLNTSWFSKAPFGLGSMSPETHLWAPHIVNYNSTYFMFYCGGGNNRSAYMINLAVSVDLWHWDRKGTLFTAGIDGRDPMVINLGEDFNNTWQMYYTGTVPDELYGNVTHVTFYRQSNDLLHWGPEQVAFHAISTGSPAGGPTESPFVIRREENFYLFTGSWEGYSDTHVFVSTDPTDFGSMELGTCNEVGRIAAHAPEVVRDVDGSWYITRCGWGEGGVYLAPLYWNDTKSMNCSSSMPIPSTTIPAIRSNFTTNLNLPIPSLDEDHTEYQSSSTQWALTPFGLNGGNAMGKGMLWSTNSSKEGSPFRLSADILFVTKDGNPTSTGNKTLTRTGSSASLLITGPVGAASLIEVELFTPDVDSRYGGLKLDPGANVAPVVVSANETNFIRQEQWYRLNVEVTSCTATYCSVLATVYELQTEGGEWLKILQGALKVEERSSTRSLLGLAVWQGSCFFQRVLLED